MKLMMGFLFLNIFIQKFYCRGAPTDVEGFYKFVSKICSLILEGQNVVIHCRGGLGRTGLCTACCLVYLFNISDSNAI